MQKEAVSTQWYLVEDQDTDAAYNMAFDYAMTRNPLNVPVLRFFDWKPSAVSIGHSQKLPAYNRNLFDMFGIDLVRRPSGGRAVLHSNELTYSVIIPKNHWLFRNSIMELYKLISRIISQAFKKLNVPTVLEKGDRKGKSGSNNGNLNCFNSISRHEIRAFNTKIVGSAQRRLESGVLQQGSILLFPNQHVLSYFLNDSGSISNRVKMKIESSFTGNIFGISKSEIKEAIKNQFKENLGVNFAPLDLSGTLKKQIISSKNTFLIYQHN